MSANRIIIRNKESAPPSNAQLEYLRRVKTQIYTNRERELGERIAVKVSESAYVLCAPEEESKIKQTLE